MECFSKVINKAYTFEVPLDTGISSVDFKILTIVLRPDGTFEDLERFKLTIQFNTNLLGDYQIGQHFIEADFTLADILNRCCRELALKVLNVDEREYRDNARIYQACRHIADMVHADICRAIQESYETPQITVEGRPLSDADAWLTSELSFFAGSGQGRDYTQRVLGQWDVKPPYASNGEEKAKELLKTLVSKREYKRFEVEGYVIHQGKDLTYHIWPGEVMTEVFQDGKKIEKWCVIFKDTDKPPTDSLIMRLLMLRSDEASFKEQANIFPAYASMMSNINFGIASTYGIPNSMLVGA